MNFNSDELNYGELENFEHHNNTYICPYCGESSVLFKNLSKDILYEIELFVYGNLIDIKNYQNPEYFKVFELDQIYIN